MERPRDIVRFETLSLIACLLNLVGSLSARLNLVGAILGAILGVALVLWISRGRSRLGRTILSAWFALGVLLLAVGTLFVARQFTTGLALSLPQFGITLVALALNAGALFCVWSADATAWLKRDSRRT